MAGPSMKKSVSLPKSKPKHLRPKRNRPPTNKTKNSSFSCCKKKEEKNEGKNKNSAKKSKPATSLLVKVAPPPASTQMGPPRPYQTSKPAPLTLNGPAAMTAELSTPPHSARITVSKPTMESQKIVPAPMDVDKRAKVRGGDSKRIANENIPAQLHGFSKRIKKSARKSVSFESESEREMVKSRKQKKHQEVIKNEPKMDYPNPESPKNAGQTLDSSQQEQSLNIRKITKNGCVILKWNYEESYPVGMNAPSTIRDVINSKPKIIDGSSTSERIKETNPTVEISVNNKAEKGVPPERRRRSTKKG